MTQKDVIKLVLILHGYDKDITIDSWKCEDDIRTEMFDVSASNDDGDIIGFMEPGLEMMLSSIFEYFHSDTYQNCRNYLYIGAYVKDLLNDEWREQQKNIEKQYKKDVDAHFEINKEYYEFLQNNNPCNDCKINTHEHWDDIHYNCEQHHNMSCEILRKYHEDAQKLKK